MPDKKLTDSEIVKACKDCLHYEACKGTYSSAKGDENILYEFDGEMYAQSGCEDFKDKDLINRLQAEIKVKNKLLDIAEAKFETIKAEAYKEFAERLKEKSKYSKQIPMGEYFEGVDVDDIDNLLKELVGEDK